MNENKINQNNLINKMIDKVKSNLKSILIAILVIFIIFVLFQIYIFYTSSKIQNNSITFFNIQNFENNNLIKEPITKLSKENNFYGILSKLELIEINLKEKNIDNAIILYSELLNEKNLDNIYKTAIAAKASYILIDISMKNMTKDYVATIQNFVENIDDELNEYKGIKLEIKYLIEILEIKKNNINYLDYKKATDLYNNIMNSETTSPTIKERIHKIHEYFSYQ